MELAETQRLLSLFAQGIGGRYYHLRSLAAPHDPWFVLPLVAWGGAKAIHVAIVMGLPGSASG